MLNMMIVDDESIIRNGIKSSINWEQYGVNICGEAANGLEALEKLIELKPDIVIMDIRMPKLNGLEVCQQVIREHSELEIIILSGYNEFDYAKKAIELGVSDYLLKPFGAEELVKKVVKLKEKIVQKKSINEERELIHENSREIISILVNKMISGEELDFNYREKLKLLGLEFSGTLYYPFIIDLDYSLAEGFKEKEHLEERKNNLIEIFNKYFAKQGFLIPILNQKHLFGILNLSKRESFEEKVKLIKTKIESEFRNLITLFPGEFFTKFKELKSSYDFLSSSLDAKFYTGGNRIIYYPAKITDQFNRGLEMTEELEEIGDYLNLMEKDKLIERIEALFKFIEEEKPEIPFVKSLIIEINIIFIDVVNKASKKTKNFYSIEKTVNIIEQIDTLDLLKEWQYQKLESYFNRLTEIRSNRYNRIVNEAIYFVNNNYQKDISLEMISNIVHVTPAYFSKLFKEETGVNFVDWLNRFRVNKSKEILEKTDKNFSTIAEEVGYNDYRYFSYNFKKYLKMSPSMYRKKIKPGSIHLD